MSVPVHAVRRRAAALVRCLRPLPGGWWLDGWLVIAFLALTVALAARGPLLPVDVWLAHWCDAHRPYPLEITAVILNKLGQGTPLTLLTLAIAAWRVRSLRSVRPLLVPVVAFAATYLSIGPIKAVTARPAPHYGVKHPAVKHPEWLFSIPGEMSYPSGHVVNSLVWYTALSLVLSGLLAARWQWTVRLVPVFVVVTTTIYLDHHWLTDDVAGVLLGVVLVRILLRIPWDVIPLGGGLAMSGWARRTGLAGWSADPRRSGAGHRDHGEVR